MLSLQDWVWYYQVEKKMCLELAPKFTSMFEVHHNKDRCKKVISISYGFTTNLIPSLIFNRTFFLSNSYSYFPCYMLIKAFLSFLTSYCPVDWYKLILGFASLNLPPTPNKAGAPLLHLQQDCIFSSPWWHHIDYILFLHSSFSHRDCSMLWCALIMMLIKEKAVYIFVLIAPNIYIYSFGKGLWKTLIRHRIL